MEWPARKAQRRIQFHEYRFENKQIFLDLLIENEMKSKMIVEMKASLKNYYNSYIKLRECKEASSNVIIFNQVWKITVFIV